MRKILLCVAAMVAMVSCKETSEGVEVPPMDKEATIKASIEDGLRAVFDKDAKATVVETSGSCGTFARAEGDLDPVVATFLGKVSGVLGYRVITPAVDAPAVSGNKLAVDFTSVRGDSPLRYMISDVVVDGSNLAPEVTMYQLNPIVSLEIMLGKALTGKSVKRVKVTGVNSKAKLDLSKGVDEDGFYVDSEVAEIVVDCEASVDDGGYVNIKFGALPTAGIEGIGVEVTFADGKVVSGYTPIPGANITRRVSCMFGISNLGSWTDFATDGLAVAGEISSAQELAWLAKAVNSGSVTDGEYKLTKNIDLSGHEWEPIGNGAVSFTGTFDGAGYTISGMDVDDLEGHCKGLFGSVSGAEIKDLTVKGEIRGANFVGGVVGESNDSKIINCVSEVAVFGKQEVGGIVGANYGLVYGCVVKGNVFGNRKVGGIVGLNGGNGKVLNCGSYGLVSGDDQVGGVVGINSSWVVNCFNRGDVSGSESVGGVAGSNNMTLNNCYNSGNVTSTGDDIYVVGAICGEKSSSPKFCYWDKDIYANGYDDTDHNIIGMPTEDMQSEDFVDKLNYNAEILYSDGILGNPLFKWTYTAGQYPELSDDPIE